MVSIIVPVYNTPVRFLKKCVDSLISQTYDDIEILLINDGSMQRVADCICGLSAQDSRIQVFHKDNGGVSSARNLGLDKAQGEYVAFVDSDDWVDKDFIELLVRGIEAYNTDLSIVNFVYEKGCKEEIENGKDSIQIFSAQELWKQLLYSAEIGGFLCNKLFKRDLIPQGLNENLHYCEDFVFTATYTEKIKNAAFIDEKVYHYRQGQDNACSNSTYNNKIFSLLYSYKELEEIYRQNSPKELPYVRRNTLKIALNLRARYKLYKAENPEQYEILEDIIRSYMKPVLKSKIGLFSKMNIILTWIFPTLLLRVKNMILRRAI